jgi:hypothetical protein
MCDFTGDPFVEAGKEGKRALSAHVNLKFVEGIIM